MFRFFGILLPFLLLISSCRPELSGSCSIQADLLYLGQLDDCSFIIISENQYFEPTNINDWVNLLTYNDTQKISIDYQILTEFSTCNGIDKIELFCLSTEDF